MKPRIIKENVHWVGALDWDRRLFDDLIPLPEGTSYNAYVVQGSEKTALIDTVEPEFSEVLFSRLETLAVSIDYVIANHAEQDHSGVIPQVLAQYPKAKVVATPKCKNMLLDLALAPEDRIITVEDGEKLSLGDKTLEFIYAAWVHWPETMLTYLQEDKILFPCDLFGAHIATTDLYVKEEGKAYFAAKRYYAEIMMPFRKIIQKHLKKLQGYELELIAPSHGQIYPRPDLILDAYDDWVNGEPKNIVVLPYISMHGSTRKMVDYLVDELVSRDITVKLFNITTTDIGEFAMALVEASTIVLGTPTVLGGAHPSVVHAAYLANALRPKIKFISIIGSYGWGGKTVQQLTDLTTTTKAELLEPIMIKGHPQAEDFAALEKLAETIAEKHKNQLSLSKN